MDRLKRILSEASVYTGLLMGAGFASGKEIMTYFVSFGSNWIKAMLLATALFSIAGGILYYLSYYSGGSLSALLYGKRNSLLELINGSFLLTLFWAMISAAGTQAEETFGISRLLGMTVVLIFGLMMSWAHKALELVNSILTVIMIFGGIIVFSAFFCLEREPVLLQQKSGWVISALLYVSYNLLPVVPVLECVRGSWKNGKEAFLSGMTGGCFLGICGLVLGCVLEGTKGAHLMELPVYQAAITCGRGIGFVASTVILSAILSTVSSTCPGSIVFFQRIGFSKKKAYFYLILGTVISIFFPFSFFVGYGYRMFGFLGFIQLMLLWVRFVQMIKFPAK